MLLVQTAVIMTKSKSQFYLNAFYKENEPFSESSERYLLKSC